MSTIICAACLYWALLVALRLLARRVPNLMTPFEMILMFLMGGMGMQAVLGEDRSLTNAFLGITTIVLMHVLVAGLKQCYPSFGRVADGTPVIVFDTGTWNHDSMRQLRLQVQDVMAAARQQGYERLEQVKYAVAERNGSISIVGRNGKG